MRYGLGSLWRGLHQITLRNPHLCECDSYFYVVLFLFILIVANFCGVYDILIFERSFPSDFSWPPHVFDQASYQDYQRTQDARRIDYQEFSSSLTSSLEEWKLNAAFWKLEADWSDSAERPPFAAGMMGMISQIPVVRSHIRYLKAITAPVKGLPAPAICADTLANRDKDRVNMHSVSLLILVKSAVEHFDRREAIRKTWAGNTRSRSQGHSGNYEVLFLLGLEGGNGVSGQGEFSYKNQAEIMEEQAEYGDLVQTSFIDSYFNNTSKLISGLHYVLDNCPVVEPRHGFIFLTDDDMFLNVPNLEKLTENIRAQRDSQSTTVAKDVYLGLRFPGSKPKRWRLSKWYVSTTEYPFSWYPPYITAAAVLLSKDTADKLYYASHFVPLFRFDDIYLGILAHMLGIESQGLDDEPGAFHFEYLPLDEKTIGVYRDKVIAVHGYHLPDTLLNAFAQVNFKNVAVSS